MNTFKSLKESQKFGKVTKGNSKILGSTFSTDPFQCKTGGFLAEIENSVCKACYARKLAKVYPSALQSWKTNLELFRKAVNDDNLTLWCHAIAYQIKHISDYKKRKGLKGANLHRWFASGDLDSIEQLKAFVYIAKILPSIKFWLPTREATILRQYLNTSLEPLPKNLVIRLSDNKIDQLEHSINFYEKDKQVLFSSVHSGFTKYFECPAYKNGGSCGDCSECWKTEKPTISYKKH